MSVPSAPAPLLARHETAGGLRIYTLTIRAFPHLPVNVFLCLRGQPQRPDYTALIDTGSSFDFSHQGLLRSLTAVRDEYGEQWSWQGLSRLVITHPHPDHVGGLPFVRTQTAAPVAAHALAVPTIERPHVRWKAGQVETMLRRLGVPEGEYADRLRQRAKNLMLPEGVEVQTPLADGDLLDGIFRVIHTPGHEGSQICLQADDILFSADHLLPRNSPPLLPEWILPGSGLRHYLDSLGRVEALGGVRLALGSHDEPMTQWRERVAYLRRRYDDKLKAVLDAASEPQTVYELTCAVHPRLRPAQALLLLDQTAALVEYLHGQGRLKERTGPQGEAFYRRA